MCTILATTLSTVREDVGLEVPERGAELGEEAVELAEVGVARAHGVELSVVVGELVLPQEGVAVVGVLGQEVVVGVVQVGQDPVDIPEDVFDLRGASWRRWLLVLLFFTDPNTIILSTTDSKNEFNILIFMFIILIL